MTKTLRRKILAYAGERLATNKNTYVCIAINAAEIKVCNTSLQEQYSPLAKEFCAFFDNTTNNAFFSDTEDSYEEEQESRLLGLAMFLELGDKI